eukprot:3283197-Amphidinium_carterae.1
MELCSNPAFLDNNGCRAKRTAKQMFPQKSHLGKRQPPPPIQQDTSQFLNANYDMGWPRTQSYLWLQMFLENWFRTTLRAVWGSSSSLNQRSLLAQEDARGSRRSIQSSASSKAGPSGGSVAASSSADGRVVAASVGGLSCGVQDTTSSRTKHTSKRIALVYLIRVSISLLISPLRSIGT